MYFKISNSIQLLISIIFFKLVVFISEIRSKILIFSLHFDNKDFHLRDKCWVIQQLDAGMGTLSLSHTLCVCVCVWFDHLYLAFEKHVFHSILCWELIYIFCHREEKIKRGINLEKWRFNKKSTFEEKDVYKDKTNPVRILWLKHHFLDLISLC